MIKIKNPGFMVNLLNVYDVSMAIFKVFESNTGIQADPTKDGFDGFDQVRYYKASYMNDMMQRYKNWANKKRKTTKFEWVTTNVIFQFFTMKR